MSKFIEHFVHPQDPILGIKPENIVLHLDESNWSKRALMADDMGMQRYVYINSVKRAGRRKKYFCVNDYVINHKCIASQQLFENIDQALAFANQLGAAAEHVRQELAA